MSYPVPGPADRTTALPLRLRIPPLSLSSAWETRAAMWEQWRSGGLVPPAGTRRFFKAELQRGCVRSGRAVLWLDVFPLCGPSRCSDRMQALQLQRRGSGGLATAPLAPWSAVRTRCIHGLLRNGSTDFLPHKEWIMCRAGLLCLLLAFLFRGNDLHVFFHYI